MPFSTSAIWSRCSAIRCWEGFVIENLIAAAPPRTVPLFYRTGGGAEIDLLLEMPKHGLWAIEIKRGSTPRPEKGFYAACQDLKPKRRLVVNGGNESYRLPGDVEVTSLSQLANDLTSLSLGAKVRKAH